MSSIGAARGTRFCGDRFSIDYHGVAHTHIDALCHMMVDGKLYNGFSHTVVSPRGATRLSIVNLQDGIFSRAVLVDIPRLRGVPYLEPGDAVLPEDLDTWLSQNQLKLEAGDVLLVRTGRWARRDAKGPWKNRLGYAGLHASCAPWLKAHDVAVLGTDAAADVLPSGVEGVAHPIHQLAIVAMGMHILDNLDLETVAREAVSRSRWDFLLVVAPLPVNGATGSPVNPLAVF